jgi:hypothetical protein
VSPDDASTLQILGLVFAGVGFLEGVCGTVLLSRSEKMQGVGAALQSSGFGLLLAGIVFHLAPFGYTPTIVAGVAVAGVCAMWGVLRLVRALNAAKGMQSQ